MQQVVAVRYVGRIAKQDQDAVESEFRRGGYGLAAVVGLHCTSRDQGSRAFRLGRRQQVFQLAGFIAAQGQTGLVIALDPKLQAAQCGGQSGHGFNRSRQVCKAKSRFHAFNPLLVSDFPCRRITSRIRGSTWLYSL